MPTRSRLRIAWYTLIGAILLASLWPRLGVHGSPLGEFIGHGWAHFLIYVAAAAIALLAWRSRTGLTLSFGLAILSIGLQLLRGIIAGYAADIRALVINLLGVAAGILLGLNILILKTGSQRDSTSGGARFL